MTTNTLQTAQKWSVQASNLRPPVNVSPAPAGETPSSPSPAPLKSRFSPRKDGETAHPTSNQTAICAACGEPMDEYLDCHESEDGEHVNPKTVQRLLRRLRSLGSQSPVRSFRVPQETQKSGITPRRRYQ